ncbi:MAG: HlyD family efflux transporter periplasmic adaptor subunit [Candidatus Peribacteraceae bacterium]|jgi:RND family efflux transporter MFP subunit
MMTRDVLLRRLAPLVTVLRGVMQRIVLRSYLLGCGVAVVLGAAYLAFGGGNGQEQASAETLAQVGRRTISSSVKATGTVTFASEQELRFNQKGKVANVYVKEGDRVQKGQLIAQLDASTVTADIRQAQLSVAASALQLQQLHTEKEKSLIDAENALRETERQALEAQNSLAVALEKLPTDIAGAERAVKEKEAALEQAQAALEQARTTTLQDLGSTAQSVLSDSEDLLDTIYGILVNDTVARRMSGTPSIEIYHRIANDVSLKNRTEQTYYAALEAVAQMRSAYGSTLPTLRDTTALGLALSHAQAVARALYDVADSTYQILQGAVSDPNDFTVADINGLKQAAMAARTSATTLMDQAETAQASLTGGQDGLTSITIQQKQDALDTAQHALLSAQENLSLLKTQTPGDLQKQEASLQKIRDDARSKQAALNVTTKSVDVNVKLKQNDLAQKSTSLQKTQKTMEDYRLVAPFEGVIRRLDYQVGDNLLDTGEEKYVTLENPDFLIVTVLLDQVDVVRVKKDMAATIAFDALPGQEFTGTIDEINSTPVEESGVVSYEVAIRLATPADLTILSGMTATVEIETTRKESVLAVPNLALSRTNGVASVRTSDGRTLRVEPGATDGQYTEILSGLEEGQSIISLNVITTQSQTSNANAAQIFRMGGGMGGPMEVRTGGGTRNTSR